MEVLHKKIKSLRVEIADVDDEIFLTKDKSDPNLKKEQDQTIQCTIRATKVHNANKAKKRLEMKIKIEQNDNQGKEEVIKDLEGQKQLLNQSLVHLYNVSNQRKEIQTSTEGESERMNQYLFKATEVIKELTLNIQTKESRVLSLRQQVEGFEKKMNFEIFDKNQKMKEIEDLRAKIDLFKKDKDDYNKYYNNNSQRISENDILSKPLAIINSFSRILQKKYRKRG